MTYFPMYLYKVQNLYFIPNFNMLNLQNLRHKRKPDLKIPLTLVLPESETEILIQNSRNGSNALKTQKAIFRMY